MTTSRVSLANLRALTEQVRQIGAVRQVRIEMPEGAVDKARWLAGKDRDFFSVTPSMQAAVAQAMVTALRRGGLSTVMGAAPEAIRAHVVRRFEAGGFDMRLRPITAAWRSFKAAHGMDTRVGIATGALLAAVRQARIWLE